MKMIIAIISQYDEDVTVRELNKEGYFVTKLATVGGFLKASNTTILIGCEDEKVEHAEEIIRKYASKRMEDLPVITPAVLEGGTHIGHVPFAKVPKEVGGCTLFVVDVEHFEKV